MRHARARLRVRALAVGVGVGSAAALLLLLPVWTGHLRPKAGLGAGMALMVVAVAIAWWRTRASRGAVAAAVERRAADFRNLLVTAVELADHPDRARPAMRDVVWDDAVRIAERVDVPRLLPLGRASLILILSIAGWIAAGVVFARFWHESPAVALASGLGDPAIIDLSVRVTPPEYTGLAATSVRNPDHLDLLTGSRLDFDVEGHAATMSLTDAANAKVPLASNGAGRFTGGVNATVDSYLAFEPVSASGAAGVRRLVTISVRPDRPPAVRVTAPGKDLYLSDMSRTLDVAIAADDDLAMRSLKLVYTKVSGSGEDFTFTEGEAPVQITRHSDQSWTATGALALATLGLAKGDTLVYRAVAVDSLPGRAPVESDAYIVQVLSPSDVATEGFATGDDRDKYALSEQMIVIKTEQLHAKKPTLSAEAFNDEAVNLSAMQRSVRAEFVFMLGGELEDIEAEAAAAGPDELHEENEAAGEQDLLAGRMQNQGRQDLLIAIRRMSEAATSLAVSDTQSALTSARAAVAALQRAFTKSRLILRTLSVRERIDPTRRLTGDVKGEAPWRRPLADSAESPRVSALRRALDQLGELAGGSAYTTGDRTRLAGVAESILQIDPASKVVRDVATRIVGAADAIGAGRSPDQVAELVSLAAVDLTRMITTELRDAPDRPADPAAAALSGALTDRLRRGGGRP